ncbi:MAG: molybdenum cofactor guanylyltransferase [Candidatus Omnitrophica bacterium]|nr:molybdenum cofactor guanylyltransferase [Candidatus Omnitrophota bacterium]
MRATAHRQVLTAIILAGGKASRMKGKDKAFLKINHEPLIKRQLRLLKKTFKQIIIVTNTYKKYINFKGVKVISDVIPHRGPLGGIYSGLLTSKDKYNFVVACDMPFINLELIKYMFKKSAGYDVVIPYVNNRYEPLFCVYSKKCIGFIKQLIDKRIFKISKLFTFVKVKKISKKEVLRFGQAKTIFMNINTLQDLEQLRK